MSYRWEEIRTDISFCDILSKIPSQYHIFRNDTSDLVLRKIYSEFNLRNSDSDAYKIHFHWIQNLVMYYTQSDNNIILDSSILRHSEWLLLYYMKLFIELQRFILTIRASKPSRYC